VAGEIAAVLARQVDLGSKRRVLDVGCGCGRIATALSQHLSGATEYIGVDILPGFIEFGRRFISPRYPRFRFLLLDQANLTYDFWKPKESTADLRNLSDATPPGSIDLAISISLFTHLDYAPALENLGAIARLLETPGGEAFITVFVLDPEAREGIGGGRTGFRFAHRTPSGELFAEKIQDPTYAVGYSVEKLDELVRSAGLYRERWIRGYWSQGKPGETFQDVLVLRKL
jgi:SAM-dependent methyltransferase